MNVKNIFILLYIGIPTISFQIIGIIGLNKYDKVELKHLFIYMNIAICLSLTILFVRKILNKKSPILDFIFVPSIIFVTIYSLYPLIKFIKKIN